MQTIKNFALIGKKLGHSFSKSYFENKWRVEHIDDCQYHSIELDRIEKIKELFLSEEFQGLNVTIPYKTQIIPYLDSLSSEAREIQSVNCIKLNNGKWIGHNTDALAFITTLKGYLPASFNGKALILGSGGSSKAVQWALKSLNITFEVASTSGNGIPYPDLHANWNPNFKLIINTSPLGMWPSLNDKPNIPYQYLDNSYYLYDLIYNPEKTLFLNLGDQQGSKIKNGLEMLYLQADYSWQFWNE